MIHPIAGKCKHCKADLTGYHAARPAANAPLPALHHGGRNGHTNGQASGQPAHAPLAHPVAIAVATAHDVQSVLPPRPSGRSHTAEPTAPAWRTWPVLVIILAMVAIVVAVVLMVWPASADRLRDPGKHALQPPPAPERMQTAPEIKQQPPPPADRLVQPPSPSPPRAGTVPDPWGTDRTDPLPQAPSVRPTEPNDAADPDDDDDVSAQNNLLATPRGPSAGLGRRPALALNGRGTMILAMVAHMCRKMAQCGTDDALMTNLCDGISRTPSAPPANCPAAARCLQHIDALSCGSQISDLSHMGTFVAQFHDCADATGC